MLLIFTLFITKNENHKEAEDPFAFSTPFNRSSCLSATCAHELEWNDGTVRGEIPSTTPSTGQTDNVGFSSKQLAVLHTAGMQNCLTERVLAGEEEPTTKEVTNDSNGTSCFPVHCVNQYN